MKNKFAEIQHKLDNKFPKNPTQTRYIRFMKTASSKLDNLGTLEDKLKLDDRLKTDLWEMAHD